MERSKRYQEQGEDVLCREKCTVEDTETEKMGIFWSEYAAGGQSNNPWFDMIYGDESAALFADSNDESIHLAAGENSLVQFHDFFDSHFLDPWALGVALHGRLASVRLPSTY